MSTIKTTHKLIDLLLFKQGRRIILRLDPNARYTIPASRSGDGEDQEFTQDLENYANCIVATYVGGVKKYSMQFVIYPAQCNKEVILRGYKGYQHGRKELDALCSALYGNAKMGIKAHNMKEGEFNNLPEELRDIGNDIRTWLSNPFCEREGKGRFYGLKSIDHGRIKTAPWLATSKKGQEYSEKMRIWPVLSIPTFTDVVQHTNEELGIDDIYLDMSEN